MAQQKIQSVQLSDTGVIPGSYTHSNLTVDSSGRISAISNGTALGVTSVGVAGTAGRISSSGGPVTSSGTITIDLVATAVTPGNYVNANISVDQYGRITSATDQTNLLPTNDNLYTVGNGSYRWAEGHFVNAFLGIDSTINNVLIGFRDIPRRTSGWAQGECLVTPTVLNTADMAAGRSFSFCNETGSNVTITAGPGVTLRKAGTATTGNLTVLPYGMVSIWCNSSTVATAIGNLA